jgi:hypothetical protein
MKALVDLGLQLNYVSIRAVHVARLHPLKKLEPYSLQVANRQPMPKQ